MSTVNTRVNTGNTKVNMGVNNSSTNTNNIANVAQRKPGVQTLPLSIPVKQNAPAPSPQIFVPTAISPGPLTYTLSGGDTQSLLNQPQAMLMDGPPDLTQYTPPVYAASGPPTMPPPGSSPYDYASPQPSLSPQNAAALIAALSPAPAVEPLPKWKDPVYVVPTLLALVAIAAIVFWWRSGKKPAAAVARTNGAAVPYALPRTGAPYARLGNVRFQPAPQNFAAQRRAA